MSLVDTILHSLRTYWPAHLLLLLYTLVLAHHAWSGKRATKGIADYYIGGRALGGVALGLSFFATYSSTNSFVGFSGQSYDWGIAWLLLAPMAVGFSFAAWRWVAPRLRRFTEELGSLTIPDFIGFRFDSNAARVAAAVIETLQSTAHNVLLQRFVAESKGTDIRALVVGDRVVAAMRRRPRIKPLPDEPIPESDD